MVDVSKVAITLLKPTPPSEGPPAPDSWDINWPGFFTRGIKRLKEEPPWKTIPEKGLKAELIKEFEVVTGRKID